MNKKKADRQSIIVSSLDFKFSPHLMFNKPMNAFTVSMYDDKVIEGEAVGITTNFYFIVKEKGSRSIHYVQERNLFPTHKEAELFLTKQQ